MTEGTPRASPTADVALLERVSQSDGPVRRFAPRVLVLTAFVLALVAFTSHLDREARFLAVGATLGWVGVALADGVRARISSLAAPALVLAVVALPEGISRSLAVTAVLLLFGSVALVRHWREEGELRPAAVLGLGFLSQALFRPEWVLVAGREPTDLLRLLAGPVLVAGAYRWVRARWTPPAAATALLASLALARGATLTAAVAILAPWLWELGADVRRTRGVAVWVGLVAVAFWRFRTAVAGALASGLRRVPAAGLLAIGMVATGLGWALPAAGTGLDEAYRLLVVLPALVWPGLRRPLEAAGLLLLAAGASALGGPAGAAIVATVAVSRLDAIGRWPRGVLGWAGVAGLGAAATSAYPWLREDLAWVGGSPAWTAVAAVAIFAVGHVLSRPRAPGWVAAGLAAWALLVASIESPGPDLRRGEGAVVLTADGRFWGADWGRATVCRLTVETALANGSGLPPGSEVGWVGLLLHEGPERRFPLHAGVSTGEWAARRIPALESPAPWIHWVAGEGLFGQRYRIGWEVEPEAAGVRRVRVVRSPDLPANVELMVWKLQAGPC